MLKYHFLEVFSFHQFDKLELVNKQNLLKTLLNIASFESVSKESKKKSKLNITCKLK